MCFFCSGMYRHTMLSLTLLITVDNFIQSMFQQMLELDVFFGSVPVFLFCAALNLPKPIWDNSF